MTIIIIKIIIIIIIIIISNSLSSMGRTMAHWLLQLHTDIISHLSEAKQYKNVDIAVLKVAVRYQFSEGKVSLNRRGRNQSKRCSAISIPQCFLFATEQNTFPER